MNQELPLKEFFFLRHGQTDYSLGTRKTDHGDVSLNETGVRQAQEAKKMIERLPIQSVCFSPFKRAKETKDIISENMRDQQVEMEELGECSSAIWEALRTCGTDVLSSKDMLVRNYIERVVKGMQLALSYPGPVLIVAHGGIHWTLCSILRIKDHDWMIAPCIPVHFFIVNQQWKAQKLSLGSTLDNAKKLC